MRDDDDPSIRNFLAEARAYVEPPQAPPSISERMAVGRAERARKAFRVWLSRLDPALPDAVLPMSAPLEVGTDTDFRVTTDMLAALHMGDRLAAFRAIGSPPALRYWAGLTTVPMSARDFEFETFWDSGEGPRPTRQRDHRSRVVVEAGTGDRWPSASDLAREIGVALNTIYLHLSRSGQKTVKGRTFYYEGEQAPQMGIDAPVKNAKMVVDVESGEEWPSASAAAAALGVPAGSLYQHLGGRAKTLKGRKFAYKDQQA